MLIRELDVIKRARSLQGKNINSYSQLSLKTILQVDGTSNGLLSTYFYWYAQINVIKGSHPSNTKGNLIILKFPNIWVHVN